MSAESIASVVSPGRPSSLRYISLCGQTFEGRGLPELDPVYDAGPW